MSMGEQYILRMVVDVKNDQSLIALEKSIKSAGGGFQNLQKQAGSTGKSMASAAQASKLLTDRTKRINYAVQNASYQFSDLAVQIQGGVDPMRALSQQLPQLLGGLGMVGAGLAFAAAIMPTVIMLFT